MEVLRESATIVRNWLGAYSCPAASAPIPLVLRPDRLGLGATPEVVSEESKKRKLLGDKIGRKLKNACKVQKATAALLPKDETGDEEEELVSRSTAVRERTHQSLPMVAVYQRLGKRKRKKQPTVSSPAVGAPVSSHGALPLGETSGASEGAVGASLTTPSPLPNTTPSPLPNTTPSPLPDTTPSPLPDGKGSHMSDGVESDGNSFVHTPSDSTPSPIGGGDNRDRWKRIGGNSASKAVETRGMTLAPQLLGKTKSKQSLNFSFSLSRSPYSRVRDRCMLTRNGSKTRHRRNICTK